MIQGEKMSCICLYVNPMGKILLDGGSFREKKKDNHDMFSTIIVETVEVKYINN